MEFGDDAGGFTMWAPAGYKPGVAVTWPYDKGRAAPGNGNMVALVVDTRAQVDALKARPGTARHGARSRRHR